MSVNATFSKDEIARLQELSSGAGHPLNEKELDDMLAACALLYVTHITMRRIFIMQLDTTPAPSHFNILWPLA